jgi:hypothetical protein
LVESKKNSDAMRTLNDAVFEDVGPQDWRQAVAEAGAAGRFVAAVSATLAAQSHHRINAYNFVAFGRDGCSIEQYLGMRNINEVVLALDEEMVMFRDVRIKIRLCRVL